MIRGLALLFGLQMRGLMAHSKNNPVKGHGGTTVGTMGSNKGQFKPGQKRPANAGRKPGTKNKSTLEFQAVLARYNFDPGEELIYCYQEQKKIYQFRKKKKNVAGALIALDSMTLTADKICQFVYPKKKAVEHTGEVGIKTFADFIASAEADDVDEE